jgi:TRAP transporter 4TM/12TM fusion protein
MAFAAIAASCLAMAVSMVFKETRIIRITYTDETGYRIDFSRFIDALENGAKSTLTVGVACAVAGIIACVITTTGIGSSLISIIIGASGGYKIVALFLTMLTCIILGMGVPTTANYVIMATTCAPVLIRMGIPSIAAHMFVFYFGIVADITPPVALAAYAGAAIAHGSPMRTGVNATKLAIAAFIIPYILALNPAMVFVDTTAIEVIAIVVTSLVGMFALSMALEGFYRGMLPPVLRIVAAVGGLMLIYPGTVTDIVGLVLVGVVIGFQIMKGKQLKKA